ncbi:transferase family-domain-containing protein, partial [Coniella lustricola]
MPSHTTENLLNDFPLDTLGQQARINRLYTSVTFCFPLSDSGNDSHDSDDDSAESTREEVIETLQQGLDRLATSFPWTAGQVIRDDKDGVFKIVKASSAVQLASRRLLVVKDLRKDPSVASWKELQENEFPFRMMDEEVLAPRRTMDADADDNSAERPVLLIQANFVRGGGLLLTVSGQHGSMDMAGLAQVIALLAKGMRGEVYSRQEIEAANVTRKGRIPLPAEDALPQHEAGINGQQSLEGSDALAFSPCSAAATYQGPLAWAHIAFSAEDLRYGVKRYALKEKTWRDFISRDDALTALMWQAISRAREESYLQHSDPTDDSNNVSPTTRLTRMVDVRQHFGLPATYPGLFVTSTAHSGTLQEIAGKRSVGSLALDFRAALKDTEALKQSLQKQAAAMIQDRDAVDKENIAARTSSGPRLEIKVSSWAKEKLYDVDFGLFLGKPEAIRRPRFASGAREGLLYFLPETRGSPGGEVVVALCLREGDMSRLRERGKIVSWGRWI